jgi:transmembrane sensor
MQQHYRHVRDFLNDDSFTSWVLFGENKAAWQQYLTKNPDKRLVVEEARRLLLDIRTAEGRDLPAMDQKAVWGRIRANLPLDPGASGHPVRRRLISATWAWAASIILLLGSGWLVWQQQQPAKVSYYELTDSASDQKSLIEKVTWQQDSLRIVLEDGSTVVLGKNSKLSYPAHFDKGSRTVILTGDAFFEVAKDPTRPFYVYSNEIVTRVLGTSFRVQAIEGGSQVVVQVKTGRVSVYKQPRFALTDPEADGLVLLPNQQVTYSRIQQNLSRRLVEAPLPVVAQPENIPLRYDEVPASKILRDIEAQYGITILFNDDVLNRCILTTTLGDEPLHDKLDLICKTIGATYKEVDAQLIVESKGCQ